MKTQWDRERCIHHHHHQLLSSTLQHIIAAGERNYYPSIYFCFLWCFLYLQALQTKKERKNINSNNLVPASGRIFTEHTAGHEQVETPKSENPHEFISWLYKCKFKLNVNQECYAWWTWLRLGVPELSTRVMTMVCLIARYKLHRRELQGWWFVWGVN